ncbi:MAG: hypothetical protein ACJA13_001330 [Paraglaciecola sp.]|jgi:hypothetical protein
MKSLCLLASVFICLHLAGCQFQTNNVQDAGKTAMADNKVLRAITLTNGQIVSNCEQYNNARSTHLIMDTVNNSMIASEYLSCSLANTTALEVGEADSVAKQLLALRVRQFPLSIAQLYGRKTLLAEAGFNQVDNTLLWSAEQHSVVLQVKAKATDVSNRYLIWVSDVITDGNYHAYYPAWVEASPDPTTIKVMPLYQSGF